MNEKWAQKVIEELEQVCDAHHERVQRADDLLTICVSGEIANAISRRISEIKRALEQAAEDEFIAAIRAEIAQNAPPAGPQ